MPPDKPVPKRNRHPILIALASIALVTSLAAYFAWTRVSALMVLRRFVEQTGIPVEIRAARWDMRVRELFKGHIRDLHLELHYQPLDSDLTIDTPVDYVRKDGHWSIQLAPTLRIDDLPPANGTLGLELDLDEQGTKTRAKGATIDLHLHQARPLSLESAAGRVRAEAWKIDGWIKWARSWSSELNVQLSHLKAETPDASRALDVKSLEIQTRTTWPLKPPLPLELHATVKTGPVTLLEKGLLVDEPGVELATSFRFDGHKFEDIDLELQKPMRLKARGSFAQGKGEGRFSLSGSLEELVNERLVRWLEATTPILRRAKAKGTIELRGNFTVDKARGPRGAGQLKLDAASLELPSKDVYADGLKLSAPLSYPESPDWGHVKIDSVEFHSVKLKKLSVETRLSAEGIDLTTEDEDGRDQPIHQSVWGGTIDIEKLYAHIGGKQGTELTAAVNGGPFTLPAVQSDLCIAARSPLAGSISFTYPRVVLDHDSLRLIGDTNLVLFNGAVHVGDLEVLLGERVPHLKFNVNWDDLDLHAIGEWTHLGDMRGSLHGSLGRADFMLTRVGVVPKTYQLTLRGAQRGGNKMSFYGRAIDNILAVLGLTDEVRSGAPGIILEFTKLYRNWLPAKADILGFTAKSDGDWTELTTFDPPEEASTYWCNPQKHYLLCGEGFTIPLETHGVYPVIMKTDVFHAWLTRTIDTYQRYFKEKNGKGKSDDTECTPPWK